MNLCPSCDQPVDFQDWICPFCDFILDPSVLSESSEQSRGTTELAWQDVEGDGPADAIILGDVTIDPNDFQVVSGAGASQDGRTTTFLFYTSGTTSRIVRPHAVPKLSEATLRQQSPTTPYEDFILSLVDGVRSAKQIHESSGLAPQEVMISLLTLQDKKIIYFEEEQARAATESDSEEANTKDLEPVEPRDLGGDEEVTQLSVDSGLYVPTAKDPVLAASDPEASETDLDLAREDLLAVPTRQDVDPTVGPTVAIPIDKGPDSARTLRPDELNYSAISEQISAAVVTQNEDGESSGELVVPTGLDNLDNPDLDGGAVVLDRQSLNPIAGDDKEPTDLNLEPADPTVPPPSATPEDTFRQPNVEVDAARMAKAENLFNEALKDRANGNLVSARMNMKLALTFNPTNELYKQALSELGKKGTPEQRTSQIKAIYDRATEAERRGNYDEAIGILEEALDEYQEAAMYNRLGVLLATRKHEFDRAQSLIEEAIRRAPNNSAYENNLSKVLQLAAKASVEERDSKPKRKGLLSFLARRR